MAMLEAEGFGYDNYVDIFDGGPTVTARTDQVRTVRDARIERIARLCDHPASQDRALVATGQLGDFRAWIGHVARDDELCTLPAGEAAAAGVGVGDEVRHVRF